MQVEAAVVRWLRAILMVLVVPAIGSAGVARAGVHVVDGRYKVTTVVKDSLFLASGAGKVGALAGDGDSLVALDVVGGRLLRIDPKKLAISVIADGLPASNGPVGVGASAVEFGAPLFVAPGGDIYLATAGRGVVQLKKSR
jgi:hypothetical protein